MGELLCHLWQGAEDAHQVLPDAREGGDVEVQQAAGFEGDVRCIGSRVPVSIPKEGAKLSFAWDVMLQPLQGILEL